MTLADDMPSKYSEVFWGSDFRSVAGTNALVKRNQDGKRMCQDYEDYLRKRSKIETEYSKSLSGLTKCFKERYTYGVLEATFSALKEELHAMVKFHQSASDSLHKQADLAKKFRDDQTILKKMEEESLHKSQNSKLSQYSKTLQLQKIYVKKSTESDMAEVICKEVSISQSHQKEVEKARNKAIRADDDAQKADAAYKGAVMVLDECRVQWEHDMLHACKSIQEMDEERIRCLRQQLWYTMNVDSKLALDIDNSCEKVREVLEKCDVISDIHAFIAIAATGTDRPDRFEYQHYSKLTSNSGCDSASDDYSNIDEAASAVNSQQQGGSNSGSANVKLKMPNMKSLPNRLKKKTPSSGD